MFFPIAIAGPLVVALHSKDLLSVWCRPSFQLDLFIELSKFLAIMLGASVVRQSPSPQKTNLYFFEMASTIQKLSEMF